MTQAEAAQQIANHPLAAPHLWMVCRHEITIGTRATMEIDSSRKNVVVCATQPGHIMFSLLRSQRIPTRHE